MICVDIQKGTNENETKKHSNHHFALGPTVESTKIPKYHKIALNDIPKGASIIKNGICIGTAIEEIDIGAHIHVHNIVSNRAVLKEES